MNAATRTYAHPEARPLSTLEETVLVAGASGGIGGQPPTASPPTASPKWVRPSPSPAETGCAPMGLPLPGSTGERVASARARSARGLQGIYDRI
jgi:hypothetical protein